MVLSTQEKSLSTGKAKVQLSSEITENFQETIRNAAICLKLALVVENPF